MESGVRSTTSLLRRIGVVGVTTMVSFHAHPDDEAILCGGTLAKAAAAGHRTVLVTATLGECGETPPGLLDPGQTLAARRRIELDAAGTILGVHRTVLLGYLDSGMRNTADNDTPGSFWTADLDEAAHRLAAILTEENAEVLTVYDDHGTYGHPDHIQVHRVGRRAAELAGTPYVFEATLNRDRLAQVRASADEIPAQPDVDGIDDTLGLSEREITTVVDVTDHTDAKRAAIAAHASQYSDDSFFLAMPPVVFRHACGTEWYRQIPTPTSRARTRDLLEHE
jgi:LmbE family N-acetylglucosaminyl deacetylase